MNKRTDYINWNTYFMGIAKLAAKRSKDPTTQVGACLVNSENKIIGIGYNGLPIGCSDDDFPWDKHTESILDSKHPYVVHAELNAILNATTNTKGSKLFVTLFPCSECSKLLIQAGVAEIYYISDKNIGKDDNTAAKRLLNTVGIKLIRLEDFKLEL